MGLFGYLMRVSRRTFILAITASVISGAAGASVIAMVNLVLTHPGDPPLAFAIAFVLICLCALATRFTAQVLLFRLSQGAIHHLRLRLAGGILSAPLRRVEQLGIARLYSTMTDDVIVIATALPGLPLIVASAAFVTGCIAYLAVISPLIALTALAFTVLGVALYRLLASYGTRFLRLAREEQDRLFDHFRAVTEGVKELKLNRQRRQSLMDDQLAGTAAVFRDRSVVGLSVFEGAAGGGQAIFFVLIGLLLFVLPQHVTMATGTLASSVLVILVAVGSLQSILNWLPMLGRAAVALKKVEERRSLLEQAAEGDGQMRPGGFAGCRQVQLRGVSHAYPGPEGERFVLGPIDLEISRGEIVFIVGPNGSGKTTLAKVLTGLYPPESGLVLADGIRIDAGNRESFRQLFSVVFSDFFLFDTLHGLPTEGRVAKAQYYLSHLQLAGKVSIRDDGFSTTALSQGQRKRLALLAAYLEDRPFYVFDEWAADQDPAFREFFYTHLLPELKARDKAVVIITHDDRYFFAADRLVQLECGQVRQEGAGSEPGIAAVHPAGHLA